MFQVIGQVWREVVGCRNWPVMRVPQFIALRRNVCAFCNVSGVYSDVEFEIWKVWHASNERS